MLSTSPGVDVVVVAADSTLQRAGEYADVRIGRLKHHRRNQIVAVKILRGLPAYNEVAIKTLNEKLIAEARMWISLHHQNVLEVYGINYSFSHLPAVVMEYCRNGNILEYLKRHPAGTKKDALRWQLIIDATRGLAYLHSHKIVHGDIRAANILIKEDGKACLADYGLTFIIDQTDFTSSKIAGSARWSPPEVLNGGEGSVNSNVRSSSSDIYPYSYKSDIYSLAMTMQEIATENVPFHDIRSDGSVILRVVRGDRPALAPILSKDAVVDELVRRCWESDPYLRPHVSTMLHTLESVYPFATVTRKAHRSILSRFCIFMRGMWRYWSSGGKY